MADIVEIVLADHERIMLMHDLLQHAARHRGSRGPDRALARVWDRLAFWIELHADTMEEICCPAMFGTTSAARSGMQDVAAELADIREAVSEARLHDGAACVLCNWLIT